MSNPKEAARHLLASISESLNVGPDEVARVAGQFITPGGNRHIASGSTAGRCM